MTRIDLKRFSLLASLDEVERGAVEDLLETVELRSEESLFREGDEAEGLVLVDTGALRIESQRGGRKGILGPGETLGSLALIAVGQREVTATAAEPTRLLLLPRSAFMRLVDDAPRAGCRLLEGVLAETAGLLRGQLGRITSGD